jgi:hypothetical protein
MSIFRHHPDGIIYIDDFSEPLAEFLVDEPAYSLASPAIGRVYTQGQGHWLTTGDTVFAGEYPWVEGDTYIARKAEYQAAYDARHEPPPPTEQDIADAEALADVQTRWQASALHNKTPAQIYTAMQLAIDGWTSLAQAKADLRAWLPALVAALGWTVLREQQRD